MHIHKYIHVHKCTCNLFTAYSIPNQCSYQCTCTCTCIYCCDNHVYMYIVYIHVHVHVYLKRTTIYTICTCTNVPHMMFCICTCTYVQVWVSLLTALLAEPSSLVPAVIIPNSYPNQRTWDTIRRCGATALCNY